MKIREDDPRRQEITNLIQEHLQSMAEHSPPESVHALDLEELCAPDMTFWAAWQDQALLGCGALKELDSEHGEIKSMRTATAYLRKGVAAKILKHIMAEAEARSYRRLSLETGSMDAFAPARALYARYGFEFCGPFGDYELDPYSVFMTRVL